MSVRAFLLRRVYGLVLCDSGSRACSISPRAARVRDLERVFAKMGSRFRILLRCPNRCVHMCIQLRYCPWVLRPRCNLAYNVRGVPGEALPPCMLIGLGVDRVLCC